ncbi:MAG: DUF1294 domain-containing protein [Clostridia bacterium]|nr:DUF1294 domain-containing protein [Clostridia bacterium]
MLISLRYGLLYLLAVSLAAVILTVSDKRRAKRNRWRVPEATLLWVAAFGGSLAMLVTMHTVRHKTRHPKFMWGLPAILIAQLLLVGFTVYKGWWVL